MVSIFVAEPSVVGAENFAYNMKELFKGILRNAQTPLKRFLESP